jgi:hypothetical protein
VTVADEAKPPEPRGRRMVLDPELAAMQDCSDVLDSLGEPEARCRVIRWLADRYRIDHRPPGADRGPAPEAGDD